MNQDFLTYQAQTSPNPLGLKVSHAEGSYIYDSSGKAHLDFVAGVSVCSLGHCHPKVVAAIQQQAERYLQVLLCGQYMPAPAVAHTALGRPRRPPDLAVPHRLDSRAEAVEGGQKLARPGTGRPVTGARKSAYHRSSMG